MNATSTSPRRPVSGRGHRVSRFVAAAAFSVVAAVASLGLNVPTASAVTFVSWTADCNPYYYQSMGRTLTIHLNTQPIGTTMQADLYKYVPSAGGWVYQKAGDWSRVNSGGYWQKPGQTVLNTLQLTGWSAGYYALYVTQWNPQNVVVYQGWSNYCYYPS